VLAVRIGGIGPRDPPIARRLPHPLLMLGWCRPCARGLQLQRKRPWGQ